MEDDALKILFRRRDESAITQLDHKYGLYCRTIARNILGGAEDIEECVSDVYFRVWAGFPSVGPEHFKGWLGTVTRNTALSHLRQAATQKRLGTQVELLESELCELFPDADSPEHAAEARLLGEAISAFLRTEAVEARVLFLSRYWYAMSLEDAAKRCRMSQPKAKSLLFRMRKRLKIYLQKEGIWDGK